MSVSVKQFGSLFREGGFSTNMQTGEAPKSGYMVALSGAEQSHPSAMIHPSDLRSFAETHKQRLGQPGHYMGGWNDTERGAVDLDVSVNMPSGGPVERGIAHGAMITHNQRSLYNVDTDKLEWNSYYGLSKQAAHAKIKSQYESAAREYR